MTDEQIVKWATEVWGNPNWTEIQVGRLRRFAQQVAAHECEACATIADQHSVPMCDGVADIIGNTIRARRDQHGQN